MKKYMLLVGPEIRENDEEENFSSSINDSQVILEADDQIRSSEYRASSAIASSINDSFVGRPSQRGRGYLINKGPQNLKCTGDFHFGSMDL